MAIAPATGNAANAVSAASIACGSFTTTTGRIQFIVVVLGSTSSSVTSITDTGGGSPSITFVAASNGSGVRVEVWKATGVATKTGNVFTANVSPNTTLAIAAEEYSGSTTIGINATGSDVVIMLRQGLLTQDASNFIVVGFGIASQSGDTLTAQDGTSRQSSIPAATRVGVALYDNTALAVETLLCETRLSTARNWASVAVEIRTSTTPTTAAGYTPASGVLPNTPGGFTTSAALEGYNPPISGQIFPPLYRNLNN